MTILKPNHPRVLLTFVKSQPFSTLLRGQSDSRVSSFCSIVTSKSFTGHKQGSECLPQWCVPWDEFIHRAAGQRRSFTSNQHPHPLQKMKRLHKATIAFGSNLGDRVAHIEHALAKMRKRHLNVIKLSALYETKPMYYDDQDPFLNGACQVETELEPLPLLDVLQAIENDLGRKRLIDKGPRTIDLDIVLYNNDQIKHPRLEVPHRLMLEREFVLRPLADILPKEHLPSDGSSSSNKSIEEYLAALPSRDTSMSPITSLSSNTPLIRSHDPSRKTLVMAILNTTPDSFSDGSLHTYNNVSTIKAKVSKWILAGADIIDIGGQSTRPKADLLSPEEELQRVIPIVEAIRAMPEAENVAISIDTFYAEVARQSILAGADIINDVSAGLLDKNMFSTVAELGKTIILMHMRGDPQTMSKLTQYPNGIINGVTQELSERVAAARDAGIAPWRIILDPGIGFAKTQSQNLELLRNLRQLRENMESSQSPSRFPWLVGTSRKGFVGKITGAQQADQRAFGTAATVTASIQGGAEIIRVHDVEEMIQVTKMADAIYRQS